MNQERRRIAPVLCLAAVIFLAALLPAPGYGETLRFVFMADSRGNSHAEPVNFAALNAIHAKILKLSPRPAFVVFGGDQSYRGYNGSTYTFAAWKKAMEPLTSAGIKLYTALGNHELYYTTDSEFTFANQQAYQQEFTDNPSNGPPGYERLVYSFASPGGDAFFAVLDPYYITQDTKVESLIGEVDSTQMNWLLGQLAKTQATHKFLFIHTPYYHVMSTNSSKETSYTKLWSHLDNYRFDLYLCGHVHLYSRKTIDRSILPDPQISPPVGPWKNNVVQLLNGTCGAGVEGGTPVVNRALWHVYNDADTYYFSVVDIEGKRVKVNSYRGNTGDYEIFDSFTIPQQALSWVGLLLR